jgi:hypothetical protein
VEILIFLNTGVEYLEEMGIGRRVMVKWIVKKSVGRMWT